MRIAMFSWESLHSIRVGGLGVHVTELAAGLERKGHEVHVITRRGARQGDYDRIDGVHYHRVDHGVSDNFVESMNLMCQAMAHKFSETTRYVGHFDLAHGHDWLTGNALAYVRSGFRIPTVFTMHSTQWGRDGNVFHPGFARWIRDAEAAACHETPMLIAVSQFLADEVERIYGVDRRKLHVVPNGVSYRAFDGTVDAGAVKRKYGIDPLAPTVFCAGRMTPQKGMDLLIDSLPMVRASYPSVRYVISGDGPEQEKLWARAAAVGAGESIVFLPGLSRGDYVDLLRSVDIMAVPSRNEPFGIVALEAWAAGKPVVATLSGGPREFIWHDVNGFLVNTDAGGLAHGIGSLLADHDHCRALGANGRKAVEAAYNWDVVAGYTEGVYRKLLS